MKTNLVYLEDITILFDKQIFIKRNITDTLTHIQVSKNQCREFRKQSTGLIHQSENNLRKSRPRKNFNMIF